MRRTAAFAAGLAGAFAAVLALGGPADAQQRKFSFAYDQPTTTAYGIAANIFDAKLKEVSGGKFSINQFPGAQLGQEPQMLEHPVGLALLVLQPGDGHGRPLLGIAGVGHGRERGALGVVVHARRLQPAATRRHIHRPGTGAAQSTRPRR